MGAMATAKPKPHCLTLVGYTNAFTILDELTGVRFLIDTGSSCSVMPINSVASYDLAPVITFSAANGMPIDIVGRTQTENFSRYFFSVRMDIFNS